MTFAFLMFGCFPDFNDEKANTFVANPAHDYDKDGFDEDNNDCNDLNDNQYPGAPEICDGLDNDCNGLIDDQPIDILLWYADTDGDGFGDEGTVVEACLNSQPPNHVEAKERGGEVVFDCDDTEAVVNPDGIEQCDLLDNDCDGIVDNYEGPDAPVWYADTDGDGFGSIHYPETKCEDENGDGPLGYVENYNDCDDNHTESHPFVEGVQGGVEVCDDDGKDENCDGLVNDASASDAETWYRDADGDGYGNILINQRACLQPSGFVLNNTDCDDGNADANPGVSEVCDTVDNDCDSLIDEADAADVVVYHLDSDGDGFGNASEVLIVCPMYQPSGYVLDDTDCDDFDATQNPSAIEDCNGEDDDCDGGVDEDNGPEPAAGSPTWYLDGDGDLYGDETQSLVQCSQPPGHVSVYGDCNDSDAFIHPEADELCTPLEDENCDGDTTYGVPLADLPEWFPDSDGDSYGNPSFVIRICEQPQNYVDNPDDCDDTDDWVHPQDDAVHGVAHLELCNGKLDLCENDPTGGTTPPDDELDDDLDGYVECSLDVSAVLWEHPTQGVSGGNDCDDTRAYRYPGADERCNGIYDDCNSLFVHGGLPSDEVDDDLDCFVECGGFAPVEWEGGVHACSYRDLNGVVQAETTVIGGEDCNDAVEFTYVGAAPQTDPDACLTDFDGDGLSDRSWDLCSTVQTFDDARFRIEGTTTANAKVLARGVGHFDADGVADILISSGQGQFENTYHRLISGTTLDDAAPVLTESDYLWSEESYYSDYSDRFPYTILDDVDGDGLSEYAYGYAFGGHEFNGFYRPGYVALYLSSNFSNPGNGSTTDNQDLEWAGPNGSAGMNLMYGIGDLDQDGLGEFMMIASGATENFQTVGKAYLYYGSTLNLYRGLVDLSTADKVFIGTTVLKVSHALNLDVDGDSVKDVVVVYNGSYANASYANFVGIYLGASLASKPRNLTLFDADLAIHGTSVDTLVGRIIGNAGDVDGDGTDDLILSEYPSIYHLPNYNLVLSADLDLSNPYQSLGDVTSLIFEGHDDDQWSTYNKNHSFVKTLGDLDGDGLSDLGINWYASDADAQWDTAVFLGSSIQSPLNAQNDTGLDTGQNAQPTMLQFTEGDFHFEDVQSGLAGGDLDQDGLGEIVLSNYTDNYSVLGGGVIGVFSPCEN